MTCISSSIAQKRGLNASADYCSVVYKDLWSLSATMIPLFPKVSIKIIINTIHANFVYVKNDHFH